MNKTWIVVADSSRARIFKAETPAGPLEEIKDMTQPEARLHEGDLITDNAGRERNNGYGAHPMSRKEEHKQEAAIRFANQICDELDNARAKGEFERLYVVAPPTFLGMLRKCRKEPLNKLVVGEIDKDLSTLDAREIRERLPDFL